ncbi:MAG: 6-hydroxymethylpterin diphosphokinase MptE-like protein [Opitutales bacterium]
MSDTSAETVRTPRRKLAKRMRWWSSRSYWKRIQNLHTGKRGFIIGNGPSLKIEDLERLKGEVTLAANRIYLAFDQTAWRPSYVSVADAVLWPKIREEMSQYFDEILAVADLPCAPAAQMRYYRYRARADALPESNQAAPAFSADLLEGIYGGYTVTYDNLQIATWLGLNPIYLIGCDHHYAGETGQEPEGQAIVNSSSVNHFVANYRNVGEAINPAPIARMNRAFREAQRFAELNGRSILNATRGGHLEVFPRVDFDSLFN